MTFPVAILRSCWFNDGYSGILCMTQKLRAAIAIGLLVSKCVNSSNHYLRIGLLLAIFENFP